MWEKQAHSDIADRAEIPFRSPLSLPSPPMMSHFFVLLPLSLLPFLPPSFVSNLSRQITEVDLELLILLSLPPDLLRLHTCTAMSGSYVCVYLCTHVCRQRPLSGVFSIALHFIFFPHIYLFVCTPVCDAVYRCVVGFFYSLLFGGLLNKHMEAYS